MLKMENKKFLFISKFIQIIPYQILNAHDDRTRKNCHFDFSFRSEWASKLEVEGCLKEAVKNKRFICSEHFKPEYIIIRDDKAFLLPQAVPELKLTASVSTSRPKPKPRSVQKALDDSLVSLMFSLKIKFQICFE